MKANELEEYKILSEDRREAVHIFINATTLTTAIVGLALNRMITTASRRELLLGTALGLVFFTALVPIALVCRQHDQEIHVRLVELGRALGMQKVISTRYIFNSALVLGLFLCLAWIIVALLRLQNFGML
jgi:hypothetical protein